jgi:Protein of unknown function (DUF1631)
MATSARTLRPALGVQLRERYMETLCRVMEDVALGVQRRLSDLQDAPASGAREAQHRRDVVLAYRTARPIWLEGTLQAWKQRLREMDEREEAPDQDTLGLALVGTDEAENRVTASRLVLVIADAVQSEFDDLRVRVRLLEKTDDLEERDVLRPEVLVLPLVEQWLLSGMNAEGWAMVSDLVLQHLIIGFRMAYTDGNKLLVSKEVLPVIELKDRVRMHVRPIGRPTGGAGAARGQSAAQAGGQEAGGMGGGASAASGYASQAMPRAGAFGGRLGWGTGAQPQVPYVEPLPASMLGPASTAGAAVRADAPTQFWNQPPGTASGSAEFHGGGLDETLLASATTPLTRARSRAQGVLGQIRRVFVSRAGIDPAAMASATPNVALQQAISPQAMAASYAEADTVYLDFTPAGVVRVADDLRDRTAELKKKASTKSEKATIEIVALMFQAILSEERIPPGIRVWFARLQMPVLRTALADPDFLSTTDHPARLLIDRMGSCVMGFDQSAVQGAAMELEVKRIVQVIEQYPESGKKVYQIVYDEFQKFLAKFLTGNETAQKVVSVAQQVEQKETLAIQYTIELRNLLKDMPVRDEIRDFLFKVWSEVMAVSALRKGTKHTDTMALKKSATDLVWAASAKPNRTERARVIQDLPSLLERLRAGMTLLGLSQLDQELQVKAISDTLADAFLSKTQAIPQEQIDAMARRLSDLEDFVSEDGVGDLPLDAESLEMMMGVDASSIEVVVDGGVKPTPAMVAWAQELQPGAWFTLDHNGEITQVQFAWRSERKQLNLFGAVSGKTFLIQAGRLAAYLQAGLLVPREEEALTVRATRDALAKLEANPERLLS